MNEAIIDVCGCGSKLSATSCCDQKADQEPATTPISSSKAKEAADAFSRNDREAAERLSLEALDSDPQDQVALATLGEIRADEGATVAAATLYQRLASIDPGNPWPLNKLGLLELGRGNVEAAEGHARQMVRLSPRDPQAHNLMGMTMTEANRPVLGEYHCRKAIELSGRRVPLVLANLAICLRNQGRIAEARSLFEEADRLAPGTRQTMIAWAQMEEADRKLDDADTLLNSLERIGPLGPGGTLARASVLGRRSRFQEAVDLLNQAAATRPLKPVELLERGRMLDRLGRFDDAWADFEAGKALFRDSSGRSYAEAEVAEHVRSIREFFTSERMRDFPRASVRADAAQPIFILGFPRSGTTLLEQALTTDPAISAGDELPIVHEIVAAMPRLLQSPWEYPGALAELWMGDKLDSLDLLRDHYLRRAKFLGATRGEVGYFTDKMPLNEMHLGLIALLFPKAPLLHLVRHPLDIMVSAMSNIFTHGADCGVDLISAAKHLVVSSDIVAHYREAMNLNYLQVRYEDFVSGQEATLRRVYGFIGIPFSPTSLRHEDNTRHARTASYAQVTERLYDRSVFRYRKYKRHLEPVLPILQPLIERLGYQLD